MAVLASAFFYLGIVLITLLVGGLAPFVWLLPPRMSYWLMTRWNVFALWWVGVCCGVRYTVLGRENIPSQGPYVVLANHQSAFETILMAILFPQPAFVLKRALLRIPFFGWGMAACRPIAIDRGAPMRSLRQLFDKGQKRLENGEVIIIFPEGTRMPTGNPGNWQAGGANLASRAGVPVVPMAHNAGHFWPPGFLKRPGQVTVSVGPPISSQGLSAQELNEQVRIWIEAHGAALDPPM